MSGAGSGSGPSGSSVSRRRTLPWRRFPAGAGGRPYQRPRSGPGSVDPHRGPSTRPPPGPAGCLVIPPKRVQRQRDRALRDGRPRRVGVRGGASAHVGPSAPDHRRPATAVQVSARDPTRHRRRRREGGDARRPLGPSLRGSPAGSGSCSPAPVASGRVNVLSVARTQDGNCRPPRREGRQSKEVERGYRKGSG